MNPAAPMTRRLLLLERTDLDTPLTVVDAIPSPHLLRTSPGSVRPREADHGSAWLRDMHEDLPVGCGVRTREEITAVQLGVSAGWSV